MQNRKWDSYTVIHLKSLLAAFNSAVRTYQDYIEITKLHAFAQL